MANKTPKHITVNELIVTLSRLKTATPATLETVTSPIMRKTGNPYFGRIQKISTQHVMLNFNYTNSVNNQREKEGIETPFVAHARQWGERIESTPLVQHKIYLYVEAKPSGKAQNTIWLCDGAPIELRLIQEFMPVPQKSNTQETEKEIKVRDFSIESIAAVKMLGEHFIVK